MKPSDVDPEAFKLRSPFEPELEFYLPHWPRTDQSCGGTGHRKGVPTGEVTCLHCYESAMNIDEIDHGQVDGEPCPATFAITDARLRQLGIDVTVARNVGDPPPR